MNIYEFTIVYLFGAIEFFGVVYLVLYGPLKFKWYFGLFMIPTIISYFIFINDFFTGLIYPFVATAVAVAVLYLVPAEKINDGKPMEKKNYISIMVIASFYDLLCTASLAVVTEVQGAYDTEIIVFLFILKLAVINTLVVSAWRQNNKVQKQFALANEYIPLIDELIEETRVRQHDLDNHLQALKIMVELDQKTDSNIADYLDVMEEHRKTDDLLKLHNRVLAGFLYSKQKEAAEKNIDFNVFISDYGIRSVLNNFDKIEVLGILIDNAFEAENQNNRVNVLLGSSKQYVIITVENKHPKLSSNDISDMFRKGWSTKGENRGTGLYKVNKIIHSVKGSVTVGNNILDGNYISITLHLPKKGPDDKNVD
jgi:hypothetical protein